MKKKIFVLAVLLANLFALSSCSEKDPFAGKTYEGFFFIRTTLEFAKDNTVTVNLGVYEDEKGTYVYDEKEKTLTIDLPERDTLNFVYDSSTKVLSLNDDGFQVDYKSIK